MHLARRLRDRGDFVRGLVRSRASAGELEALGVELLEADVAEPEGLVEAARGMEVVFHLAGVRRSPSKDEFFRVNAEGTRNVCEAMIAAGARRLVLCGSLAASGPSSSAQPRREEDPFAPQEWYGQSKAAAEKIAFSYSDRLEITCLRPARIIGPGDKENLAFFRLAKKGVRLRLGGGPRPLSMVDVEDVVELLLLLAQRAEAVGESFFAASQETTTLEELMEKSALALGVTSRTVFLPGLVLRGLAAAADVASKATGKHLPLNRKLARQLLAPAWTCSPRKAQQLLGFSASREIDDSIRRSAAWYLQHGWL